MPECPNCGASTRSGVNRCLKCGSTLDFAPPPPSAPAPAAAPPQAAVPLRAVDQKSRMAAGLLGIFLGPLGVHNFYLGRSGLGVTQLLLTLFTCGYGAIITWPWSLIEAIMLFSGSVKTDGWGVPLRD